MDYKTKGTCSTNIHFEVEDGKVKNVSFTGGCNGNLKGISALVEGMKVEDVIDKIRYLKEKYAGADIRQMQIHPVDVSSSGIREAVKTGQDISGAVPMAVCRYIKEYGLYPTDENLD